MFNEKYDDWNRKKVKTLIDHYSYKFFYGKKILDLGAGQGDIAAALGRLGADIICVDARQENLDVINKKYPFLKTAKIDLENAWPYAGQSFDMVLSLGLICHLKNYEQHIRNICAVSEHIVIETEVLDISSSNIRMPIYEEKAVNDLSFGGEGSILTATNIQNRLSELNTTFKRIDDPKINSGTYLYDWKETDSGRKFGNRRLWICKKDKYLNSIIENNSNIPEGFKPKNDIFLSDVNVAVVPEKHDKIRLFFNYYQDKNPERKKELDFCLKQNSDNKLLEIIYIQSETNPTYNLFFEKINELSGPDDINIISNSDIFFDETIALANNMKDKDVYALSRWEWSPEESKLRDISNSQDAWVIRGKIKGVDGNFKLGVPYCDNRIAFEFSKAGYKVTNPSKSIKSYHVHNSGIRHYSPREIVPLGTQNYMRVQSSALLTTASENIPIIALTSMSPRPESFKVQKECINSWIMAGCSVVAFQSSAEMQRFNRNEWKGVQFVETAPSKIFGNYIPISNIVKWISSQRGHVMIVNADCRLTATPGMMQKFASLSKAGLVYFVRHDVDINGKEKRQIYGIDAFMFPAQHAQLIPNSDILCMGKPWWDYVVPLSILRSGKPIMSPTFPVLYHTIHPERWISSDYATCRSEAQRVLKWEKPPLEMHSDIIVNTKHIVKEAVLEERILC